ncbi:MAG: S9 family peptidase [Pseudomonadota bacterium]
MSNMDCHRRRSVSLSRMGTIFGFSMALIATSLTVQAQETNQGTVTEAAAETNTTALRTLQPRHVFDIEYASDPQISPDGSRIVYVRRSNDIMTDRTRSNLWIINSDGSGHRPIASGRADYSRPLWSPTGDRLAYVSSAEGSPQIYVRWMDTGDTALVTNLTSPPRALSWSPDGKTIAFVMNVPKETKSFAKLGVKKPKGANWSAPFKVIEEARFRRDGQGFYDPRHAHIFVVPADGGSPRQLTAGDFDHGGPLSWANDSQQILFAANRHEGWELETVEADIFSISMDGELTQLTDLPGVESNPVMSPDGKTIAYLRAENKGLAYRLADLVVMPLDGGEARTLSSAFPLDIDAATWAGDGGSLFIQFDSRGARKVARMGLDGEVDILVSDVGGTSTGRPYLSGDHSATPDGTIAYTRGSADRPADLAIFGDGETRTLTSLNEDVLGHLSLGEVNEVLYTSSVGKQLIQGWYITPPDFDPAKTYPLLLEIHGGPHLAYGPNFSLELQRYAAEGYVVFYDNHRGSSSYGLDFGLLLQNKYPSEDDFADHMSGVDAMIAKGFIDPDRLFIAGGSAGGVSTAYAVGLTSRFKAAVAAKPIINWTSKPLTADSYIYQVRHQFPGLPWEAFEHYWQRSPLSLVGNVTTPTMLMTGEEDYRTPITESEQFYQALTLRGIPTALVRIPGSGHGIAGRPSRLIGKVEHTLAWFKRYDPAKQAVDDTSPEVEE